MAAPWAVYAAALLVLVTLFIRSISGRRCHLNLPPGPKPWPIIGNFNLLGSLPHSSIDALSKKYGPIMQLWFGSHPVVVASSPEMAKEFLKTHDLTFASRPKNAASKHLFFDHHDIVWAPYGPNWRQFRKIMATDLFSSKRIESYEHIRIEEVKLMLFHLFSIAGKPTILREHLFTLTLGIISRMVMRKKYVDEEPGSIMKPDQFREMLHEAGVLGGLSGVEDYIPLIRFVDFRGKVKKMKAVRKKGEKFLDHVLDAHIARRISSQDSSGIEDMVDVLLQLSQDTNLDVELTTTHVKAFIMEMLVGGTASSVDTMEWAMAELLRCSKAMEKAMNELDKVIGKNRWVEEKDLPQLPFIEAIMKEAFRMHPAGPLMVPHFSREDCSIAGYDIPAGTIALVNTWALGRHAESWEMPNEFQPERFMGKKIDVKGQDFELLPFGSGRRMCPGYSLALKVIQLSLANLIHGFVWSLPENISVNELNMEEVFGLTTSMKESLVAVVQPRLPAHLYSF